MDHMAAAEERIVTERLRQKLNEVNSAAQTQLSPIQDHINFTLKVYGAEKLHKALQHRPKNKSLITGYLDVELNDVGRLQAVAVVELLSKGSSIFAVYSSDLKQAL